MDGIRPVFDDIQCSSGALMAIQQCSYSTSISSLCTDSTDVSVYCCKGERGEGGRERGERGRERGERGGGKENRREGERSLKEEMKKEQAYNHHNYYLLQHQQDWMITHIQA